MSHRSGGYWSKLDNDCSNEDKHEHEDDETEAASLSKIAGGKSAARQPTGCNGSGSPSNSLSYRDSGSNTKEIPTHLLDVADGAFARGGGDR